MQLSLYDTVVLHTTSVSSYFLLPDTGVVYKRLYTKPPRVRGKTLDGQNTIGGVLAWSRATMETIVKPKRDSTPGDMCLSGAP